MFMKIHCSNCGGAWEVYERDNWKVDNARTCPHCFHEIDKQTWEKQIVPAFGAAADANRELVKDNAGATYSTLFAVDFMADHLFTGKRRAEPTADACPLLDVLNDYDMD